jgi:uncharacterized protein YdiU (UPF0061 family)
LDSLFQFNHSYQSLGEAFFQKVLPKPVGAPALLLYNHSLALELGINPDLNQSVLAAILSGNQLVAGSKPIAQAYAGHQFGYFTMLGDGRAILLGEHISPDGKRWDIQLKGAGPTPYSRRGDGRATLRAMLREYLISEAMHGLGIPSSRSLAVVTTGEKVFREEIQAGAVLTRIMKSHIRVGTFEYARQFLKTEDLEKLTLYTLERHYPDVKVEQNAALTLLEQVLHQQARLIANWMRVGFIHGVMNTDNMSIAGETFDYGPCAFLNSYDPTKAFSSIDTNGRYAFGNQPNIAHWNLSCLANALLPIIHSDTDTAVKMATDVLNQFPSLYTQLYTVTMAAKIGFDENSISNEVIDLLKELMQWMQKEQADYTNTFLTIQGTLLPSGIYNGKSFESWMEKRNSLLSVAGINAEKARLLMHQQNPLLIPRNHRVEEALDAVIANNDLQPFNQLFQAVQHPYDTEADYSAFQEPPVNGDGFYATYCGT